MQWHRAKCSAAPCAQSLLQDSPLGLGIVAPQKCNWSKRINVKPIATQPKKNKLEGVAPLVTDPPTTSSNTLSEKGKKKRATCQCDTWYVTNVT